MSARGNAASFSEYINWSRLHLELVWVYSGRVSDEHSSRPLERTLPAAWLITRGEVALTFGEDRRCAHAGEWVFPPSRDGWATFSAGAELLSVRFVACWPDGTQLFQPAQCQVIPRGRCLELEQSGREMAQAARESLGNRHTSMRAGQTTLLLHLHLRHLFLRWLRDYAGVMQSLDVFPQASRLTDERLPEALAYIEQHLPGPISESEIARHVSLSVSQLNRLFLRGMQMTPKALVDRRRLEQALQDLEYSRAPIKSIAYRLGFSSLPHFSRWFTQRTGHSPSAHRNALPSA